MKHLNRQLDIIDPDLLTKRILVIGAGGIGSWTTLALCKMGCADVTVMDFDTVSLQNLNAQWYNRSDIDKPKVKALKENILRDVSSPEDYQKGYELKTLNQKWEPGMDLKYEIVISALDDIETRTLLWEDIKKNPFVLHYLDGRMGGEFFRVYTLNLMDGTMDLYKKYQQTLVSPGLVEPIPCTAKAVIYNVFEIGGTISNFVKKICKGEAVPYEFAFDLSNMMSV